MFVPFAIAALAARAALVYADPTPSEPSPGAVFNEGSNCNIGWDADTTGVWKTMNIELMTGDNYNMVYLNTVATVDGTDANNSTFSYPCPKVSPNSAIYFYQFTSPYSKNLSWTTRFAIADASGTTTPPPNATQPDGQSIAWGVGTLVSPSSTVPAPAYGESATGAAAASSSSGATALNSAPPTSAGAPPSSAPSAPSSAAPSAAARAPSSPSSSGPAGGAASTSVDSSKANAAGALAVDGRMFYAVLALGGAALAFTAAL
ncbi:hypothetical protein B0H21DRAFT_705791 [Amylocystis lapponica]|nr:hypothetical protein B0H21DRAFT_705791 [Amylocystis lapponica]